VDFLLDFVDVLLQPSLTPSVPGRKLKAHAYTKVAGSHGRFRAYSFDADIETKLYNRSHRERRHHFEITPAATDVGGLHLERHFDAQRKFVPPRFLRSCNALRTFAGFVAFHGHG
jgi:hypothetical protein